MIEAVELTVCGGVTLRGEIAMRSSDWIVLVHADGDDIDAWRPMSSHLEDHQLTVLAVDLRGCGGSDGELDSAATVSDVEMILDYATSRMAVRTYLGGAGQNAKSVIDVAQRHHVDGLILVAPVDVSDAGAKPVPRLVLHDPLDARQVASAALLADAPGWSVVISLPAAGAAREMVQGGWADQVTGYVAAFLRDVRLHHPDGLDPLDR